MQIRPMLCETVQHDGRNARYFIIFTSNPDRFTQYCTYLVFSQLSLDSREVVAGFRIDEHHLSQVQFALDSLQQRKVVLQLLRVTLINFKLKKKKTTNKKKGYIF